MSSLNEILSLFENSIGRSSAVQNMIAVDDSSACGATASSRDSGLGQKFCVIN